MEINVQHSWSGNQLGKMEVMHVKQQNKQLEIDLYTFASPTPTTNAHDKYKHLVTCTDEMITKHAYLNMDDVGLAFNQSGISHRLTLLLVKIYKFKTGISKYPVKNRRAKLIVLQYAI